MGRWWFWWKRQSAQHRHQGGYHRRWAQGNRDIMRRNRLVWPIPLFDLAQGHAHGGCRRYTARRDDFFYDLASSAGDS